MQSDDSGDPSRGGQSGDPREGGVERDPSFDSTVSGLGLPSLGPHGTLKAGRADAGSDQEPSTGTGLSGESAGDTVVDTLVVPSPQRRGEPSIHDVATFDGQGSPFDASQSAASHDGRSVNQAEATLARHEHVADTLRLRQAAGIGLPLWLAFIPLDVVTALTVAPDEIGFVIAARLVAALLVLPAIFRLNRPPLPSRRVLRVCDYGVFTTAALSVAVLSIPLGGLTGVYPTGICAVMAARGVFVKQPWWEAVVPVSLMAATYPLVAIVAVLVDPLTAAEFADPLQRSGATFAFSNILAIGLLSVIAAHAFWVVRRQALDHRVVGPYRLEKPLGSGGMGDVWRARKPGGRRSVALKLLRPGTADLEESIHRFEREITALAKLRHPGVIRVLDYGVGENGAWYYTMPLIEGRDLDAIIDERGPLPEAEALNMMRRVVSALAAAHEAGIIHRDVKPSNIRLPEGHLDDARLLDFGIARMGTGKEVTTPGSILGTPAYLAPEVIVGDETDERTDVYGAAATLYHALAGRPPAGSDSIVGTLMRVRDEIPCPVSHWRKEPISPDLENVIARALSKDVADRPRDCRELLAELNACATDPA